MSHFAGGSIFWSPANGAHAVVTELRDAHVRAGRENGCLGFPVGAERTTGSGSSLVRTADFQGGSISWTAAGGAKVACR